MNRRIIGYCFFVMAACAISVGCVPVQPSAHDLVGSWRVVWKCGTERLEIGADATYTQRIDFAAGGTATHSGTWTVAPRQSHLSGGKLVLKDALQFCSVFGERLLKPEREERQLDAIWEWGRVILSFNPDNQGFERQ